MPPSLFPGLAAAMLLASPVLAQPQPPEPEGRSITVTGGGRPTA